MYPDGEARAEDWRGVIRRWRAERSAVKGPLSPADLARHAGALADAVVDHALSLARGRGETVSCGKGCAACCREVIPLSAAEALRLSDRLAAFPWDRRAEIEEGFRRAQAALEAAGLDAAPLLDRSAEYFALRIPCPFLSGEACAIHGERPLACREHLAVSPAASCEDYPSPFIRPVDLPFSVASALAEVLAGLGGGAEWIPLIRLPAWLASRPAAEVAGEAARVLDGLARACESRLP
jgi:Fe-S-cluster containining protein